MTVTVHYTAQSRQAAGCAEEPIDLPPGASAMDLLRLLSDRHGDALRRILLTDDGTGPRPATPIFVNDTQFTGTGPSALNDRDRITILCPISGG